MNERLFRTQFNQMAGTSSETERRFFTHLVREGIPVKVESNRTR